MTNKLESLESLLTEMDTSSNSHPHQKIDVLNELAWELRSIDPQRGLALTQKAYDLAYNQPPHPYKKGWAYSLCNFGVVHLYLGNIDLAMSYIAEAQRLTEDIQDDRGCARVLSTLGLIYRHLGHFAEALAYQLEAMQLYQALHDRADEGHTLSAMAVIYNHSGDDQQALNTYQQALQIFHELEDKNAQATVLASMVEVYLKLNNPTKALACGQASLQLIENTPYKLLKVYTLANLGQVYLEMTDYNQALPYFEHGLALSETMGHKYGIVLSLEYMARVHLAQHQGEAAQLCLERAQILAEEINAKFYLFRCHQLLAECYEQQGDMASALHHFKQFHHIKETVFTEQSAQKLKALQVQFDTQSARREAEIQRKKNIELEQEIVQRRQIARTLQESKEKYQHLVEQTNEGMIVIQDNLIKFANRRVTEITGYTVDELIDQPCNRYLDTNIRSATERRDQQCPTGEDTPKVTVHETTFIHKNKHKIYIEINTSLISYQGQPASLLTIRDITERKQTREKLHKLSQTIEQSANAIIITNLDGTIEFVNPAFSRITGYTYQEVIGQNQRIIQSGETALAIYKNLWQTITQGKVWQGELLNKKKSGELYWESVII